MWHLSFSIQHPSRYAVFIVIPQPAEDMAWATSTDVRPTLAMNASLPPNQWFSTQGSFASPGLWQCLADTTEHGVGQGILLVSSR